MELEKQHSAGEYPSRRTPLTLVIPTRNEADNVPKLIDSLKGALSGLEYRIVFVDDSSDETPAVIEKLGREDNRISLIHREEAEQSGGLSTAVIAGLDVADSEYTCVMDADLQHPPEKVREMLEVARDTNADVVVASRYTPGGSYAGLASPTRQLVSRGSKYLAQVLFREARKTSDPLTGFFMVRTSAIDGIQFRPTGFKILLEILVCASGLKVVEIPLNFQARYAGVSKANIRQGMEYLTHIASLFWYVPSAGRFWKFAMVGASGVLVNMLLLVALVELFHADKTIAWMIGVSASILSNFLLNNAFTWGDIRNSSRIHFLVRGALSYPAAVLGLAANFAVYYPLVQDGVWYVLAASLGILAGTSVNFILNSKLVFRPSTPKHLDPLNPPEKTAQEVLRELKADWVGLIRAPEEALIASAGIPRRELSPLDRSIVAMVLTTTQPALVVTGPKRFPQARTNARWANSLAIPIHKNGDAPSGVIYATRTSTEAFTQEDLHWLTAYASTAGSLFAVTHTRTDPALKEEVAKT